MWTQQLQAESRPSVDHGWSSSRLILLTYEYVHVRFECSGTGSSAPEHLRVRQQVTDDTVHWGRTHLSRKYHIPFRAGAGGVFGCVYKGILSIYSGNSLFGNSIRISGSTRYPKRYGGKERGGAYPFGFAFPLDFRPIRPRLDAYLVSESTESSRRQRAMQSRRRASRTRYRTAHGTTRRAGATCKSSQQFSDSLRQVALRCSDVAGGAAKLQDASGMMLYKLIRHTSVN